MAGMLSILEKEDMYDPEKGTLTTFFKPYILHGICAWINTNITFSTQHYSMMEKKINDYLKATGKDIMEVTTDMVVNGTGIPPKTVETIRVMKQMRRASKIDLMSEKDFADSALTPYYYMTPEDYYLQVEEKEEMLKRIELLMEGLCNGCGLTDRQIKILREYYGIGGNMPKTIAMLAEEMDTTRYFIKKDLSSAYRKLRKVIKKGERK